MDSNGDSGPEVDLQARRELWLEAMRWRRAVEVELRELGLTFKQWLVLEATQELIEETRDAVSQSDVARRLELDRMTVSLAMQALQGQGWVDRDTAMCWPALRVWVTDKGKHALVKARSQTNRVAWPVRSSRSKRYP